MMIKEVIECKLLEIEKTLMEFSTIGLYNSEGGKLLFYSYLNSHFSTDAYNPKIETTLSKIFDKINNTTNINTTFCSGLSGFLWSVEHLKQKQFLELEYGFETCSEPLKQSVLNYSISDNFDFLHGSDGILFYLNDMNVLDEIIINEWLESLNKNAVKENGKYIWESVLNSETGEKALNLSLSHGVSSKIILLAEILKKYPANKLALELLNGAIDFLLNVKREKDHISLFPNYINTERIFVDRLAWCYGDLGNGIALWRAGCLLNNEKWKQASIEILIHSSKRRGTEQNVIHDAGFCHGTSGVAHIFNRFYKETQIKEFDEARWYWLEQTLKLSRSVDGLAGFKIWNGRNKKNILQSNLLEGTMGIGMTLMGFLSDDIEDISWDRCFLLS